ncbi:thioesterase domain-containing protein [Silvimonas terrae]|uniref:Thioesterase domain-containing protein n=1 Tax=Silvimonas terrae TaxID=300266 RepID=A0A840RK06_9NEIS|nr:YiiD C-terminal domain-containing protein [Silvimonas terrae]MBB5192572.1 thioesterase domain-containing protein [Silvimonas terrae]
MSIFAQYWQRRLVTGFPVLAAMQVSVAGEQAAWHLAAPFELNRNDHATAFGGSISTLATIAGWMAVNVVAGEGADVVIQSGATDFVLPIASDFTAHVLPPVADDLAAFERMYVRRGKGRLAVSVEVRTASNQPAATFHGVYVAVRLNQPPALRGSGQTD